MEAAVTKRLTAKVVMEEVARRGAVFAPGQLDLDKSIELLVDVLLEIITTPDPAPFEFKTMTVTASSPEYERAVDAFREQTEDKIEAERYARWRLPTPGDDPAKLNYERRGAERDRLAYLKRISSPKYAANLRDDEHNEIAEAIVEDCKLDKDTKRMLSLMRWLDAAAMAFCECVARDVAEVKATNSKTHVYKPPPRTGYSDGEGRYHPGPADLGFDYHVDTGCISCKLERDNPAQSGYVKR